MNSKRTQKTTRAHNTNLILKTIYNEREISRADIARITGLTRATVSNVVAELIKEGLVKETAVGKSKGGKPPILLSIVDDSRHLIGVDLGEREFYGARINLRGEIRKRESLQIEEKDGESALFLLYELIDRLIESSDIPILGIGIGTPGLIDSQNGIVLNAVNLDWHDLHLKEILEEKYNLPVYISNDCQASALAELTFGGSNDISNLILIKIGRGTGAGIILNRQIHHGDGFGAGEIGHLVVVENGEPCRCGHSGCLETLTSSGALIKRAKEIARSNPYSLLNQIVSNPEEIDMNVIVKAFKEGDKDVNKLFLDLSYYLGKAIASLVCSLNIQRVVIAGSITYFGDALIESLEREIKLHSLDNLSSKTEIRLSSLGHEIVVLGASSLVISNQLGLP